MSNVHSDHKRIARGALWVSLFVLLGKSAGAVKEMAIAYRYGISEQVDAYQMTLAMITWLPGTVASVLSVALVPNLVRMRKWPRPERSLFLGELLGASLVVGLLSAAGLYFAWDSALALFGARLPERTVAMSREMAPGMSFIAVFSLLIAVHGARLQACERHVNTLLECIPAAVLLTWILLAPDTRSVVPLVWGTCLGFLVQTLCLRSLAARADGIRTRLRLSFRSPQWPAMYRALGVFVVGQMVMSMVTPLDQYAAANLGNGAIATLGYASRLSSLLLAAGALAIGRATLPVFSDILQGATPWRARSVAFKWSGVMFVLGVIVARAGWLLAEEPVQLMFRRGAFSANDSIAVAAQLRWGLVQVPFYFAVLVMVQLFASEGRFGAMALIAVLNFCVKAAANFTLVPVLGIAGISIATGLMHAGSLSLYLLFSVRRRQAP